MIKYLQLKRKNELRCGDHQNLHPYSKDREASMEPAFSKSRT